MSLCINPRCPQPDHPDNSLSRLCQACGSDLLLRNRYRVMRLLSNQSGFGTVYEAYERNIPKILKVLKPMHNQNPKVLELFQREALVLSKLHHPGVPQVNPEDSFVYYPNEAREPLHCLVMEKIDGPNLKQWMTQQGNHPISEQQAILWLTQLADVLHLIHQQNYFHRDIKPENVMLRSSGQLVLVDFGAAREMTETYLSHLGASGITAVSSAGYTPPEQEQGQAVPQSDFYALGRTLIFLLTAKPPNDTAIYDSRTNAFNWRTLAPHISPALADLIDGLTAQRAMDRPQTTQEILQRLALIRANQPVLSHAGVVSSAGDRQPWPTTTLEDPSRLTVTPTQTTQVASSRPVTRWIVGGLVAVALLVGVPWVSQRGLSLFSAPGETEPAALAVSRLNSLMGHMGQVKALLLLADGKTLVSAGLDKTIRLWDLTNGRELAVLTGHTSFINALSLSPDQQTLVSGGADKTLIVWDLTTQKRLRQIDAAHNSPINALAMSPDGRTLASASADGEIKLWAFDTGTLLQTLTGHETAVNAILFSRDGQWLASGGQSLRLWNVKTGEARLLFAGNGSFINQLAITSDNQGLISASADKTIRLWNLATGEPVKTLVGHDSYVNDLNISRDGQTFASAAADRTVREWDIATGEPLAVLTGFDTDIYRFVVRPDGAIVTAGGEDGTLKVWSDPSSP